MERKKVDAKVRFLKKVAVVDSGCHEWQSTIHRDGYGKFWYLGKQIQAHRLSYMLFVGEVGENWVLHKCDNRKCVNPDHLFLGSRIDNIRDMDQKGRRASKRKLNDDQVKQIRKMLDERYSQEYIAKQFSVCQAVISRIKRNVTYF